MDSKSDDDSDDLSSERKVMTRSRSRSKSQGKSKRKRKSNTVSKGSETKEAVQDEDEVEPAPPPNTFQCQCCYCDYELDKGLEINCSKSHRFCKDCLRSWIEEKVGSGGSTQLSCFITTANISPHDTKGGGESKGGGDTRSTTCTGFFSTPTVESVLSKEALANWNCRVAQDELKRMDDVFTCPKCKFFAVLIDDRKVLIDNGYTFHCQGCKFNMCLCCQIGSGVDRIMVPHLDLPLPAPNTRCIVCQRWNDAAHGGAIESPTRIVEEILTKSRTRICVCGKQFVRIDGCNKMVCTCCGVASCYLCRKVVTDYTHFDNSGYVPAPVGAIGSAVTPSAKCRLYTYEADVEKMCVKEAITLIYERFCNSSQTRQDQAKAAVMKHNPEQAMYLQAVWANKGAPVSIPPATSFTSKPSAAITLPLPGFALPALPRGAFYMR